MDFRKLSSNAVAGAILVAALFFSLGYNRGKGAGLASAAQSELRNTAEGQPPQVDFAPFWKAWGIIKKDFVPTSTSTKAASDQKLVYGAIQGMVSSLGDPYTVFFPPVESKQFASDIKGSFTGVGMEVGIQNGSLTVVAPLKGSPAEAAGLRAGDRILKIDDKDTVNLSTEEAVTLIRGAEGTPVNLTISRTGKPLPFEIRIVRQVINIPVIETKNLGNGIFYIALYSFTENSPQLFRGALREFIESGSGKLVLDLRGNPGGYLEAALDMASWFLPPGAVVIREDYGGEKEETIFRSKGYNVFNDNLKMVILVDAGSASASEILAGALSEYGKATLIGEKTFGKGSVQELVPVTGDTSLKVTIARWLTPNGFSISKQGITPKIEVKRTEADFKAGRDPQLDRAVEFLKTGK
ncbi:S41 family peptidase [Candidatus Parcubacteria bacterium]|nr:S41 family peptidase [Candidatus Parcubacteria bacterium]